MIMDGDLGKSNLSMNGNSSGRFCTDIKSLHTGEKVNELSQGGGASSNLVDLRKHLQTHCGEKKNKCNQCEYECSDVSNLRNHLKTHIGEKQPQNVTNVTMHPLRQAI